MAKSYYIHIPPKKSNAEYNTNIFLKSEILSKYSEGCSLESIINAVSKKLGVRKREARGICESVILNDIKKKGADG